MNFDNQGSLDGIISITGDTITTNDIQAITGTIQTFNYTTATGNSLQGNTIIGNVASFNTINGTYILKDLSQNFIHNTGYSITTGRANTLMGNLCGNSISTGVYNTGYGCSSLKSTTSGSNNTAVGYFSLYSNTASSNTALGIQAGRNNTTGTQNLFLGYFSDTTGVFNNSTAIGYNSKITGNNQIVLGTTAETTYIAGNAFINGTLLNNTKIDTPLLTTNSIQATTGGFTTIQGTDGDFTGALNSDSISCNSMTVGAVSSGSITVGTITGSDTVINLTTQLQANNGIDLNGSFLLGGTSITTRDISITGTFSQGNYITSPTESINLYLPTTLNIPTYSIGMVSAYGNNPTCNKGLQIGNNYTGSYTTGLHETDFVNWAGTGVGGFNFYNMNSGGFSSLASISITGNITANGFVGTHYGNISGTTGNFTGTITGGAISCSSLNTNNGAISSGSISCSGLNTNNGAITSGSINTNNNSITSGSISCSSINTNNNGITSGSISCSTLTSNGGQIFGGQISGNSLWANNSINSQGSLFVSGLLNTGGDIKLSGINCNIVKLYNENGQQFVSNPYTQYSNWGGQVGYCIASSINSGNGFNNVYSMDFIVNSGSANYSTFNFYQTSQNNDPTAVCWNTIYTGGFAHTSDRTTKQNIKNLNTKNSLNKILQLRPVNYQYINDPSNQRIGFISQEVEEITPATVLLPHTKDASGNTIFKRGLNYGELYTHNIGATQELYKMIEVLQERIRILELKSGI